jgi:hypothetical protein
MIAFIAAAGFVLSTATPLQTSASDRLLDAAGVTLHIRCDGDRQPGVPMVVLEAGAGNSARRGTTCSRRSHGSRASAPRMYSGRRR